MVSADGQATANNIPTLLQTQSKPEEAAKMAKPRSSSSVQSAVADLNSFTEATKSRAFVPHLRKLDGKKLSPELRAGLVRELGVDLEWEDDAEEDKNDSEKKTSSPSEAVQVYRLRYRKNKEKSKAAKSSSDSSGFQPLLPEIETRLLLVRMLRFKAPHKNKRVGPSNFAGKARFYSGVSHPKEESETSEIKDEFQSDDKDQTVNPTSSVNLIYEKARAVGKHMFSGKHTELPVVEVGVYPELSAASFYGIHVRRGTEDLDGFDPMLFGIDSLWQVAFDFITLAKSKRWLWSRKAENKADKAGSVTEGDQAGGGLGNSTESHDREHKNINENGESKTNKKRLFLRETLISNVKIPRWAGEVSYKEIAKGAGHNIESSDVDSARANLFERTEVAMDVSQGGEEKADSKESDYLLLLSKQAGSSEFESSASSGAPDYHDFDSIFRSEYARSHEVYAVVDEDCLKKMPSLFSGNDGKEGKESDSKQDISNPPSALCGGKLEPLKKNKSGFAAGFFNKKGKKKELAIVAAPHSAIVASTNPAPSPSIDDADREEDEDQDEETTTNNDLPDGVQVFSRIVDTSSTSKLPDINLFAGKAMKLGADLWNSHLMKNTEFMVKTAEAGQRLQTGSGSGVDEGEPDVDVKKVEVVNNSSEADTGDVGMAEATRDDESNCNDHSTDFTSVVSPGVSESARVAFNSCDQTPNDQTQIQAGKVLTGNTGHAESSGDENMRGSAEEQASKKEKTADSEITDLLSGWMKQRW